MKFRYTGTGHAPRRGQAIIVVGSDGREDTGIVLAVTRSRWGSQWYAVIEVVPSMPRKSLSPV